MTGVTILIADDEARMRKLVADFLKKEGYAVLEAEDGKKALEAFHSNSHIGLVILDVMMPVLDGWTVCREIRKNTNIPIIMLTARSEETDELFGFDLGADEYVTKPFSPLILVARVQALLRRSKNQDIVVKNIQGLEVDVNRRVVRIDGERIELSPKEFELLLYFINNQNLAVSREQILSSVWDYDYYGDTRTVDTHIKRLRYKLGFKGAFIQTVRGLGYRFEVER